MMVLSDMEKCNYILKHGRGYKKAGKAFAQSILSQVNKGWSLSEKQKSTLDTIYREVVQEESEVDLDYMAELNI